jgi:hypothetical protein
MPTATQQQNTTKLKSVDLKVSPHKPKRLPHIIISIWGPIEEQSSCFKNEHSLFITSLKSTFSKLVMMSKYFLKQNVP